MNTNCLEGMTCPKCGQTEALHIAVTSWVKMTDDGTDGMADGLPSYDTEWDENSPCQCPECDHFGVAHEFFNREGV